HAIKTSRLRQVARSRYQLFTRFYTVDARGIVQRFEEQVVEYESEVGLTRAVVYQRDVTADLLKLAQQRFDKVEQMVDVFQLATAVLVQLAVAGENMQRLEQLHRLAGANFGRHAASREAGPALRHRRR